MIEYLILLLLSIQTTFLGIFLYIYLNEKKQQERIIREISAMMLNKTIDYLDEKLDINCIEFIQELVKLQKNINSTRK